MMTMTPSEALTKFPVVVILGATATGKSKLAASLARKFKGEVISADSMQVYKGLEILTNKMTQEEMRGVPHHMISVVEAKQKYDITYFRNQSLPIVERIIKDGRIPFIVGGTNYYIESLLWKILIDEPRQAARDNSSAPQLNVSRKRALEEEDGNGTRPVDELVALFESKLGNVNYSDVESYSSVDLYQVLKICDEKRSSRLHPNDRRKILRSLQVFYQTGKKHSDIISEQRQDDGIENPDSPKDDSITHLGGPLRFRNSLFIWIQAQKELLNDRINARVEEMVQKGLRKELDNFIDDLKNDESELDFTQGLLQSIGFKEFQAYLQLPQDKRYTELGDSLFNVGKDLLKIATRQYSKRQVVWITQRFLQPHKRELPPIYRVDGNLTDEKSWDENVTQPAISIIQNYLTGNLEHPLLKERLVISSVIKQDDHMARICEDCDNRVLIGNKQWEDHIGGRKHKKMKKKKEKNKSYLQYQLPVGPAAAASEDINVLNQSKHEFANDEDKVTESDTCVDESQLSSKASKTI